MEKEERAPLEGAEEGDETGMTTPINYEQGHPPPRSDFLRPHHQQQQAEDASATGVGCLYCSRSGLSCDGLSPCARCQSLALPCVPSLAPPTPPAPPPHPPPPPSGDPQLSNQGPAKFLGSGVTMESPGALAQGAFHRGEDDVGGQQASPFPPSPLMSLGGPARPNSPFDDLLECLMHTNSPGTAGGAAGGGGCDPFGLPLASDISISPPSSSSWGELSGGITGSQHHGGGGGAMMQQDTGCATSSAWSSIHHHGSSFYMAPSVPHPSPHFFPPTSSSAASASSSSLGPLPGTASMEEAGGGGGGSVDDLVRLAGSWDKSLVLKDKGKGVLRSWHRWNHVHGRDTTQGLLLGLSAALDIYIDQGAPQSPPFHTLESGNQAIRRRLQPFWSLSSDCAICAVSISGTYVAVDTNERFDMLMMPRAMIEANLLTHGLLPHELWKRALMADAASADAFSALVLQAAFLGTPSATSLYPLKVRDRFHVHSWETCTMGVHVSKDGLHSLTWVIFQPAASETGGGGGGGATAVGPPAPMQLLPQQYPQQHQPQQQQEEQQQASTAAESTRKSTI